MNADMTFYVRPVHHVHKHMEDMSFGLGLSPTFCTTLCYQDDCYAASGPSLNKEMYPPEKIGPKLYLSPQE